MKAYITRFSFPNSLESFHVNQGNDEQDGTDIDAILRGQDLTWSLPNSVLGNDIVFFQYTASSRSHFNRVLEEAQAYRDHRAVAYLRSIRHEVEYYSGHLIAVGRIADRTYYSDDEPEARHFALRQFAPVTDITPFEEPLKVVGGVSLMQYPEFSSHGPVTNRPFHSDACFQEVINQLRGLRNTLPSFLDNAHIRPSQDGTPLSRENWIDYITDSDVSFPLEAHLRQRFADFLLRDLSDNRRLHTEIAVMKKNKLTGYVDNVIYVKGLPVPVECKLNVAGERDFTAQIRKYTAPSRMIHKGKALKKTNHPYVLAVDTQGVYVLKAGEFWQCSPQKPLLHRQHLTPRSIQTLREQLEVLVR